MVRLLALWVGVSWGGTGNVLEIQVVPGKLVVRQDFEQLASFPINLGPRHCRWGGRYRTGRWDRGPRYYRALELHPELLAPRTCQLEWIRGLGEGLGGIGLGHLQTPWTWMQGALTNDQMDQLARLLHPEGAVLRIVP